MDCWFCCCCWAGPAEVDGIGAREAAAKLASWEAKETPSGKEGGLRRRPEAGVDEDMPEDEQDGSPNCCGTDLLSSTRGSDF